MIRLSQAELDKLNVPTAFLCPYFHGLGTCRFGCYSEPACQTDEPLHGWRVRDAQGRFVSRAVTDQVFATVRDQIKEATK